MTNEIILTNKDDIIAYIRDAYCNDMITLEYKGYPVLVTSIPNLSKTHVNIIEGFDCLIMALWSCNDIYVASVCFDTMTIKHIVVDLDVETLDDLESEGDN